MCVSWSGFVGILSMYERALGKSRFKVIFISLKDEII